MIGFRLIDFSVINYLSHFQRYYPGIVEWYERIKSEVVSGHRSVFASWKGSEIQGLAITKNGISSKLCHISVSPSARDHGLGSTLMSLALSNMIVNGAKAIHVTTDEEVFRHYGDFFRLSGFSLIDWQLNRYRKGTSELIWKLKVEIEPTRFDESVSSCESATDPLSLSSRINTFTASRNAIQNWRLQSDLNTQCESRDLISIYNLSFCSHPDADHLSTVFSCRSEIDRWLSFSQPYCHQDSYTDFEKRPAHTAAIHQPKEFEKTEPGDCLQRMRAQLKQYSGSWIFPLNQPKF